MTLSLVPLFQNEFSRKTFHIKISLIYNEPVGRTHFHMNGFRRRLVLIPRQKAIQKWPFEVQLLRGIL